jgi:uncharacterized membrane protein
MSSPASIHKHPIHPMLIVFPIGLWIFSFVCDIVYHAGSHTVLWKEMAFYTMLGGVVGALLAAVPGFIDYLSIGDVYVRRIATTHMVLNLAVVALFIFNLGLRFSGSSEMLPVTLSLIGIAVLTVSGWLGGTLVYEHQVAVDPVANRRRAA